MAGRSNASVKRFQRVMAALPARVAEHAESILASQAAALAGRIKAAAPVGETGDLRRSVRSVKGSKPLRYYVVAGGSLTTPERGTFTGEFKEAFLRGSIGKSFRAQNPANFRTMGKGKNAKAVLKTFSLYDYARAVEFGTSDGKPARPFFYVTYRRDRAGMRRYLAAECAKALKDGFENG